jgi:hypothetical protein
MLKQSMHVVKSEATLTALNARPATPSATPDMLLFKRLSYRTKRLGINDKIGRGDETLEDVGPPGLGKPAVPYRRVSRATTQVRSSSQQYKLTK